VGQFHFHPEDYLELMSELPAYEELQDRVASLTEGLSAARILELGTGTGETSRRVLDHHPGARLLGVDESAEMMAVARKVIPASSIEQLIVQGIEDPLPDGPFDLVISALTIHHLDGPGKADLFARIERVMRPDALFVMGDVVIPEDPADAVTPLTPQYDMPDRTEELLAWLNDAGFDTEVAWSFKDLVVIRSTKTAMTSLDGKEEP
jgi:tRNA (cmo5U34)-methyltransferase